MENVIDVLEKRGFIEALTSEEFKKACQKPIKIYCGFDPTSDSLHLGNLVAIIGLAWFQKYGHTPVALVGGATGLIGDPSGKSHERPLLDQKAIQNNLAGIQKNLEAVLNSSENPPVIVNNYDWFKEMTFIEFLRDIGKNFRLGPMLAKESVKKRLESEEGMSFTEFSYQLFQAYDFLYLNEKMGVVAQMGGSDQWGNITAGSDLVRRLSGNPVYGITFPLLTTSDGKKFGKSEKGAIWLSAEKCSPFEFYQYLFRTQDADVIKLLRLLTFLEIEEIDAIEKEMQSSGYIPNSAQKRLAEEVTLLVHGKEALATAQKVTEGIKPGSETTLDSEILEGLSSEMPNCSLTLDQVEGSKIADVLLLAGLQDSKGQARRLIKNGGVYLNNKKVSDENLTLSGQDLIDGKWLLLAAGKKNKMLVRVT